MVNDLSESGKDSDDTFISARMLNEFVYCPRLFYLEYVEGQFTENVDTLTGRFVHRNVEGQTPEFVLTEGKEKLRSVYLSAPHLKIIARLDILEVSEGEAVPIEYKKGQAPDSGGALETDRIQICAQALILRENGYKSSHGEVYYASSRERVRVEITDELINKTLAALGEALLTARSTTSPPLVDSPKCPRCSLVGICLPDETNLLAYNPPAEMRRMFPMIPDSKPVYILEQGSTVGRSGDNLTVTLTSGKVENVRLIDASQLCLFGNVHLTPGALRLMAENSIPVLHFTYGGWFYAITLGHLHKNVELRIAQYGVAADSARSLELSKRFIDGKVRNMRTLLRRNHPNPSPTVLRRLSGIAKLVSTASTMMTLLGYEGTATELYFSNFQGMIKNDMMVQFQFSERNRRPPLDPVNALLSFVYALLVKDCLTMIYSVGMDPYLGFLHKPRYGRPALALDLMEEFRPIVGDSVVLSVINNKELDEDCFVHQGKAVALSQKGRKKVIVAYHRRLDSQVTHHLFGYRLSYGRLFEVQARLLARTLQGEIDQYIPFVTR